MSVRVFVPFMLLIATGCASTDEFPSLAKRPFENGGSVAVVIPAPIEPSSAARIGRIGQAVSRAQDGQSAFATGYEAARRAVLASGASGSDSWINAQLSVSRLEPLREAAQSALADIVDEQSKLVAGRASTDEQAVTAAFVQVSAIRNDQAEKADGLLARITQR